MICFRSGLVWRRPGGRLTGWGMLRLLLAVKLPWRAPLPWCSAMVASTAAAFRLTQLGQCCPGSAASMAAAASAEGTSAAKRTLLLVTRDWASATLPVQLLLLLLLKLLFVLPAPAAPATVLPVRPLPGAALLPALARASSEWWVRQAAMSPVSSSSMVGVGGCQLPMFSSLLLCSVCQGLPPLLPVLLLLGPLMYSCSRAPLLLLSAEKSSHSSHCSTRSSQTTWCEPQHGSRLRAEAVLPAGHSFVPIR
jgi:hypothetical protein